MDTSMLLMGAIVLFILVVMFIVVYGGPSTTPIAAPTITPPVLQATDNANGCPKKDKDSDCGKEEHKKDCCCDPCRKKKPSRSRSCSRRRSDPEGPYYAHGGRENDSGLLYGEMDGFADGVAESKPAPFTIGVPA